MIVERSMEGWAAFVAGPDGKCARAELAIPQFVAEHELAQYLDDVYHEMASPRHPDVRRITAEE